MDTNENPKVDRTVDRILGSLKKEYVIMGSTHVKAWQAWLVIGLLAGVVAGVLFVANRQGEVSESRAAGTTDATPVDQLIARKTTRGSISPGNIIVTPTGAYSPIFLAQNTNGAPSILTGVGRGATIVATHATAGASPSLASPQSFIVKLDQPSLAETAVPYYQQIMTARLALKQATATTTRDGLIKKLSDLSTAERTKLTQQLLVIRNEQTRAKVAILSLVPSAKVKREFNRSINGLALGIGSKEAATLKRAGYRIYPDAEVKAVLYDSVPLINADEVWLLLDPEGVAVTGKGKTIAIIDTGIDYTHPDLGGCIGVTCKVIGGYDFVNNDADPMDDMGHGTHVASIAAGDGVLKGVAPGGSLLAYKVMNKQGSGYFSDIIAGIDRALDPNQDGDLSDAANVINLSLGGWGDPDDPMSQAVDNAVSAGTVVAVAAGNWGPTETTIASPGAARKAITVGASTKGDQISWFSSRGPVLWNNQTLVKPDLAGPGESICAAEWDGWLSEYVCLSDGKHIAISGTSMAAPHLAGAAALLLQAHPEWSAERVKAGLKNTAKDVGGGVLDHGAGRIDVLAAASQNAAPPIAILAPISTTGITRPISGTIDSVNFQEWIVSYAVSVPGTPPTGWVDIARGSQMPPGSVLGTLDTKILAGPYIIRLRVADTTGQVGVDYGYVNIQNVTMTNPQDSDIYRAGDTIPVQLQINPGLGSASIILEYGSGQSPSQWTSISSTNSWSTMGLLTGWYTLRATVSHDGIQERQSARVYLDTTLRPGWPQYISWDLAPPEWCGGICYEWPGFLEPVASDLDGDGKTEIIVASGGNPPKLRAFRQDGSTLWVVPIGTTAMPGGNLSHPLVADIDGDGGKEIIIDNIGDPHSGGNPDFTDVYAFRSDGTLVSGWPVKIPKDYQPTFAAADVDGDGKTEIVIQGNGGNGQNTVSILSGTGVVKAQWNLPSLRWGAAIVSVPAIANMDVDPEKEIVIARPTPRAGYDLTTGMYINEGEIHVFDPSGQERPGWPVIVPGVIFSSPAVGDIDKDGLNDVVVGLMYASDVFPEPTLGGIYAFDANGKSKSGWPVMKGWNYWSSPSLADLDGDGKLEIVESRLGFNTDAYHYNGQVVVGWPQQTSWQDYYSTIIGGVDGSALPNILTTAGAGFYGGGVYGWSPDGATLAGFPKLTEVDAQAPAVIRDIDHDGNVDIVASSDWDYNWATSRYKLRSSIYTWSTASQINLTTLHWPTFHHDEALTGLYTRPLPDLAIPLASLAKALLGYKYQVVITNKGNIETGSWVLRVQGAGGDSYREKAYNSLKPGESLLIGGRVARLPVTFRVDPANAIQELDETNNALTITVPTPQPFIIDPSLQKVEGP